MNTPTQIPALDLTSFISGVEDGTLTQEDFDTYAQHFVDSGVWLHLQGSWQRTVCEWANRGLVTL